LQEVAETMGAPPVKPGQVEALKYVQELAGSRKLRFDFTLQPGQSLVHSRKVEDGFNREQIETCQILPW
jgi:hypothetical protein